ncbi:MAG: hypothetical protein INH34_20280 [Phycisphaerales bacterium]|nr:hypothetical protein [Phycisphaerales bacterium]
MVSLDGFDLRFLREPDACVFAWALSRADGGVVTAARQRAAMRREVLQHRPLRLGSVRAGAAVDGEWFVVDLPDGPYDFALVRIAFDGRWRRYHWVGVARASGCPSPEAAAQAMLRALFAHWRIDLAHADNAAYARLLAVAVGGAADAVATDDDAA